VRGEVLRTVLVKCGITVKLDGLIKMYLETYSNVCISKNLVGAFPIQNGLKQDALSPFLSNFALECAIMKVQENQE
jgi:hypothetical protein